MNTAVKRILFGLLALALTLSLVACGGDGDATLTTTSGEDVITTTVGSQQEGDTTSTTTSGEDVVTTTVGSQQSGSTTSTTTSGNGLVPTDRTTTTTTAATTTTTATTTKAPVSNGKGKTWAEVKAGMPANLSGTSITVFNWNGVESITGAKKAIENFTRETGITVKWELGTNSSVYVTEIAARQAADSAPDVVRLKDVNPAFMAMLQPLSNTGYDFSDAVWDTSVKNMYSYKGTAYAANMTDTLMQQPNVLMYNKNLIRQYDLEDPFALWQRGNWTWEKFVEVCTAFKDEVGDSKDAFSIFKWQTCAQMMGTDLVTYDPNTGYKNTMSDSKLVKGFQMMIKIKEAGLCAETLWAKDSFEAGNLLFFHDAIIGARKTHFYFTEFKSNRSLGVVPLPTIAGATNYQLFCELEAYAVPKGAKNAAAAPYFMRYFLDAKNYDVNNFFADPNVLKVYNSCMANKNRFMTYNCEKVLTAETGLYLLPNTVYNSAVGQVSTVLNGKKAVVQNAVNQANKILEKM